MQYRSTVSIPIDSGFRFQGDSGWVTLSLRPLELRLGADPFRGLTAPGAAVSGGRAATAAPAGGPPPTVPRRENPTESDFFRHYPTFPRAKGHVFNSFNDLIATHPRKTRRHRARTTSGLRRLAELTEIAAPAVL